MPNSLASVPRALVTLYSEPVHISIRAKNPYCKNLTWFLHGWSFCAIWSLGSRRVCRSRGPPKHSSYMRSNTSELSHCSRGSAWVEDDETKLGYGNSPTDVTMLLALCSM